MRQASRRSCIEYCVKGAESVKSCIRTSSEDDFVDRGRWIIAQYAGVWPSTESSCNIEGSEACCLAHTATQLFNTPIAATPPSDHNETPRLDWDSEFATRSRMSLKTVFRTSSCDLGVGCDSEICAALPDLGELGEEDAPRIVRLIQDVDDDEVDEIGDCGFG